MNDFKLDSEPRIKSGFITPDAYFDSLVDRVLLNLPEKEVRIIPLYRRRPVWVTSIAAVFILSLSLLFTQKDTVVKAPGEKAIKNYLVYQSDMSTYDFAQHLSPEDIRSLENSINDISLDAISPEAAQEYLSGENIY